MTLLSEADIEGMHDTLIELSNCTVTQIASAGTLADNGDPGPPVSEWEGSAPGFLWREAKDALSRDAETVVRKDMLRVFDPAGLQVVLLHAGPDWSGVTIVVRDDRLSPATTRRFNIVGMEHESDQTLNSVILTLDSEGMA